MSDLKSKSIRNIEQKMEGLEPGSLRYQVLAASKNFKSSWINLGQILYTVYKDKMFKEWGYMSFEAYCKGEIGVQQQTASKLLHSYYFLEKNEPEFLKSVQSEETPQPKSIPALDAVNVLRLAAKRQELTEDDYQEFKKSVFEDGRDGKEVKKQVGLRLRSIREEEDPQKARAERRAKTLRRLAATIKALQREVVYGHLVSDKTAQEIEKLIGFLDQEIGE
ncbi:MAG: hypothetical protein PHH75_05805 [Candidatus Omnitrophica bacterium]|nr:hypothetical protein [Candidatus Omnitrophota bacterium]MDD5574676.1 hypothetical protein [Candidatus Omnitrophota bacterium]